MHLSEIWHSKKKDCRLSRIQVTTNCSRLKMQAVVRKIRITASDGKTTTKDSLVVGRILTRHFRDGLKFSKILNFVYMLRIQ